MTATLRLMQEDGVTGPSKTLDLPDDVATQDEIAHRWAAGQIGHPWDVLVVEIDGVAREVK